MRAVLTLLRAAAFRTSDRQPDLERGAAAARPFDESGLLEELGARGR
jgi:hypothetical protein